MTGDGWSGLGGAFQFADVELFHLEHGANGPGMFEEIGKARGNDLPGEAKLVFEPAALALAAAFGGEPGPVVIDFLLGVATHDEGDGFVEFEQRAAVERGELLAIEFEFNREDAAFGAGAFFGCGQLIEAARVLVW